MRVWTSIAPLVFLLAGAGPAEAAPPPWSVHALCAEAEAIVLGERTGPTTIRVLEWLRAPGESGPGPGSAFEIAGLADHSRLLEGERRPRPEDGGPARLLHTQRLICFLERKGVSWYALGAEREGSAGLIWIEDGRSYRYRPRADAEGCVLTLDERFGSEEALRREIAKGLADRDEWEHVLQMRSPDEKAVVLASYLLARTSPEGDRGTYCPRVRQVLPQLGEAAVSELVEVLKTARAGDDLGPTVLIINDLGQEAKAALPHLLPLLDQPDLVDPGRVLEALGRIGDASVAPRLRPFLDHAELPVRAEAAKALAVFRYQDAAGDIARSLPERIEGSDAYHVYEILSALNELDHALATKLAKQYVERPEMQHTANLLEPLLEE